MLSKKEFGDILNTYKSRAFLSYLHTFSFLSWLPKAKSQTMHELEQLLQSTPDGSLISQDAIEEAINRGSHKVHRSDLFKQELEHLKLSSGTDEVILELKDALKKSP